jgi:hypothetical protein
LAIAKGVIINSQAMIALSGQTMGVLTQGLVLPLIGNTSANPIRAPLATYPMAALLQSTVTTYKPATPVAMGTISP